jgi:hypothetical protein
MASMAESGGQASTMDSLYGEDEAKAPMKGEGSVDEQEQESMENMAVVPLKVLSPDGEAVNEGDEIVVVVKGVHGSEVEIAYAPKKKGGDTEEEPPKEVSPDDELDSLGDSGRNY